MKKTFRAAVAVMLVLAFAVVGMSAIMSVGAASSPRIAIRGENYALTGTAQTNIPESVGDTHLWYWDSCNNKYRDALANVNDGIITNNKNAEYSGENRFQLGTDLAKVKEAMEGVDPYIQIVWDSAIANVNSVYIAHHENDHSLTQVSIQYTTDKETWTDVSNLEVITTGLANPADIDVKFDAVADVLGIRVTMLAGNDANISEIEVFNNQSTVTSILEDVDISVVNNIALGTTATASSEKSTSYATKVVDGNSDSLWEPNTGKESAADASAGEWIKIDLKESKEIAKIRLVWGLAEGTQYTISVSDDDVTYTDKDITAAHNGDLGNWNIENIVTFNEGVISARYIKLTIVENVYFAADAQLREFEVYGPVTTAASSITLQNNSADSVRDVFVATSVNKKEMADDCLIKAEYTITKADGTKATGHVVIASAYETITLGEEEVDASDIEGANATDYVTGVLFTNVPANATVEVVFTAVDDILD